ncbi:MAG: LPS translocon maturation chaperone LptM [Steroidobacteraceae bacterium]
MRAGAICGWIAITGALLACGGCGFKGPLYLPERNPTVVTHSRQAGQPAPAVPATQAAPTTDKSKGKKAAPGSPPVPPSPPPR